jgi:hypothetical protein
MKSNILKFDRLPRLRPLGVREIPGWGKERFRVLLRRCNGESRASIARFYDVTPHTVAKHERGAMQILARKYSDGPNYRDLRRMTESEAIAAFREFWLAALDDQGYRPDIEAQAGSADL